MFSLVASFGAQRAISWIFAIFLVYDVTRIQEVWPSLNIPRLPKILASIFIPVIALTVPQDGWVAMWKRSLGLRCMLGIMALAIITIPIGMFSAGSWYFFMGTFLVQFLTFLVGTVLFRDRVNLRRALGLVIIATTCIALQAITGQNATVDSG
jgi:hypothetical protein